GPVQVARGQRAAVRRERQGLRPAAAVGAVAQHVRGRVRGQPLAGRQVVDVDPPPVQEGDRAAVRRQGHLGHVPGLREPRQHRPPARPPPIPPPPPTRSLPPPENPTGLPFPRSPTRRRSPGSPAGSNSAVPVATWYTFPPRTTHRPHGEKGELGKCRVPATANR